ncbi:hypothetical protein [Pseudomonas syringae]|uniref:Fucose-specific lectin n=1 Tax=Pseudomonas syringae TaxID=317 RepID=A0A085V991_PSESX|nr:hypothetical protein [Pseudomonas syringae]KFE52004.1 hypothetical protein IV01_23065 [Pseudomonas syringae]
MKLNTTENIHGIMQGFSTLTAEAEDGCRTALHNGTLFCVYLGKGRKITYIMKPQEGRWGDPALLVRAASNNTNYVVEGQPADTEHSHYTVNTTDYENIPSLVSFNNKLWLIYTNELGSTEFHAWDESHASFVHAHERALDIVESATYAQLNNILYMFYKLHDSSNIYSTHTTDMELWSKPALVKKDGVKSVSTYLSPVAITYQGLIHLVYKDRDGGFFLLKGDGECWTSPIAFIGADYGHSPGIAVHNGLLKLVFCNLSKATSNALYQYSYDGNALSPVVASTRLSAGGSPALSTQGGKLVATYLESAPTP